MLTFVLQERVDKRLARDPDRPDLWTRILDKSEGSDGLSLGEHHANASLFMLAGTETTATALSGTTYQLLRNPQAMAKLTDEIRSTFSSFEELDLESLARQKYLMAVLHEGLRMYPPVPSTLPRKVPEGGMAISGEWVPEGTTIGVHHLATYRSEAHFKHAYEFRPERWLGDPEFKDDHLDALEPFSVGPRNCLGKSKLCRLQVACSISLTGRQISPGTRCVFFSPPSSFTSICSYVLSRRVGQTRKSTRCGRRTRLWRY